MSNQTSKTEVCLTGLKLEDSKHLFYWINQKELVSSSNVYNPIHEANHVEWFNRIRLKEDVRIFAIRLNESDNLIGTCQLYNINFINRSAEIQIRIGDKSQQGKGLGTQVIIKLTDYGFNDLNLNRIYAKIFSTNERSLNAFRKSGYIEEGYFKECEYINGKYIDVIHMAILKIKNKNEKRCYSPT